MILGLANNFFKESNLPEPALFQDKSVVQMYTLVASARVELAGFNQRSTKLFFFN